MTNKKFERTLAYFCSPVLLNKKVSNLVSVSKSEIPNLNTVVDLYNEKFNKFGLEISKICECDNRMLILVYKKASLLAYLKSDQVQAMLANYGYKNIDNLQYYINNLRIRTRDFNFPHEIGLFLGYPYNDVVGFIENKGKNYEYCGYWKVYENTKGAKKLFDLYDKLRIYSITLLNSGKCLEEILFWPHLNKYAL
ncbi:DUF3793 family protein [Peptostreptococcus equinus]|uniref:DUF3793 family protein n=1 Tax=Peptostreptococcus equinus TaxID=3003601 RepID=A0ABY7JP98_9FIRM|nr:DUF3793 family protein [Peptostreptococcus sp. CBA3647]WAW15189.1 DUF3793 family protein [Peptostreptococcus sp. CBA3647]